MATSTFGRPQAFRPTPSTCFPPPPPPPLPYDVPCLRGPRTLPLRIRVRYPFLRPLPVPPTPWTVTYQDLPIYGNTGGEETWTSTISAADILNSRTVLRCGEGAAGIREWFVEINTVLINPEGHFMPFATQGNQTRPQDFSIVGQWNDIRYTELLFCPSLDGWDGVTVELQWYTTGAPNPFA